MREKRVSQSNVLVKECIVTALLKLIYTKPLSAITISELCEKAGVSRMSFYRNYESKEEIFKKRLEEIFEEYRKDSEREHKKYLDIEYKSDSETQHKNVMHTYKDKGIFYDEKHMTHYLEYLLKYKEFMKGLVYCGFGNIFLEMINDYMCDLWGYAADKYTLYAFSGALYNTFNLWSQRGYNEDGKKLAMNLARMFAGSERKQ